MKIGTRQETRQAYATLRTIPKEARDSLLRYLKYDGLGHTLFGNKPSTMMGGDATEHLEKLTSNHALNPQFAFVKLPGDSYQQSYLINLKNLGKVIDQHPSAFGLPPAPSELEVKAKLAALTTPEGLAHAQQNHVTVGTMLGYGESNARRFVEPNATRDLANAEWHTEGPHAKDKEEQHETEFAILGMLDSWKGPVRPFGMIPWDSHESTLIANDNVGTALSLNADARAMRDEAKKSVFRPHKEDMLVMKALDAMFGNGNRPTSE